MRSHDNPRHHHHHGQYGHSPSNAGASRSAKDARGAPGFGPQPDLREAFSLHRLWHAWHAIGRHQHGRGGGRLMGGGPGGFDNEGDGFPRGRKFNSDDLQLMLLALIDEAPRHGYELIKALEARSNGFYAPSPGMVYPALTYLEELGYVTVQLEGNRKRYSLADAGREYLTAQRERADLMLAKLSHIARKMDSVRRAFAGEAGAAGDDDNGTGWLPEFIVARRALKHALLMRDNASPDEQRRIAAILRRATAEIEGNGDTDAG